MSDGLVDNETDNTTLKQILKYIFDALLSEKPVDLLYIPSHSSIQQEFTLSLSLLILFYQGILAKLKEVFFFVSGLLIKFFFDLSLVEPHDIHLLEVIIFSSELIFGFLFLLNKVITDLVSN